MYCSIKQIYIFFKFIRIAKESLATFYIGLSVINGEIELTLPKALHKGNNDLLVRVKMCYVVGHLHFLITFTVDKTTTILTAVLRLHSPLTPLPIG